MLNSGRFFGVSAEIGVPVSMLLHQCSFQVARWESCDNNGGRPHSRVAPSAAWRDMIGNFISYTQI
eukprot:1502866-Amphidinium_carterae.1